MLRHQFHVIFAVANVDLCSGPLNDLGFKEMGTPARKEVVKKAHHDEPSLLQASRKIQCNCSGVYKLFMRPVV